MSHFSTLKYLSPTLSKQKELIHVFLAKVFIFSICFHKGLEALAKKAEGKKTHPSLKDSYTLLLENKQGNPNQPPRNQH